MKENKIYFNSILRYNLYFWGIWFIFYSVVSYINITDISYIIAVYISTIITLPLFLLSLLVWPVIRRLQFVRYARYKLTLIHILLANFYTVLWLGTYYGILFLVHGSQLHSMFNVQETIGWQYPSGITFYLMVAGAYYSLIYYREIKTKEINEDKLQMLLKDTQFQALKNQLNPHFLFNSLNSVNALIKSDPDKARSMLVKLSDLLRLSLNNQADSFVPLERELEFAHVYLDIEKIRLADRLEYRETISDSSNDIILPVMILQPLIENSIKHGIAPSSKKGFIELEIMTEKERLIISVSNSISSQADLNQNSNSKNNGLGLNNLEKRLETLYGSKYSFSSGKKAENHYGVELKIPLEKDKS